MAKRVLYYYHSLSSPWAYLGGPKLHALVAKHDLHVELRPTTILPENGGVPLRSRPDARQRYHEVELDRWRRRLGMPLVLRPKYYPTDSTLPARMVVAATRLGWDALPLSHALLHALWSEERDVKDPAVRMAVANSVGLDGERLLAMQETPDNYAAWEASHREAIDRGCFGTPTYVYRDVLYWGQDRLDFLDEALTAEGPAA
ncbi:MAG: 2-hydroxychromene-2-carboxylate isomerase [bacterium]|jgi:2-hydroxychromene-2-carboxylate isomerase|nr:DsbA family protein [Betaproteobacteria bacterium]